MGIWGALALGCSDGDEGRGTGFTTVPMTASNSSPQGSTGDPEGSSGETGGSSSGGGSAGVTDSGETSTGSTGEASTGVASTGEASTGSTGDPGSTGEASTGSTGTTGEDTTGAAQVCGDGVVAAPEQCDDGNADNTDACLDTCVSASCGDGFVQAMVEACDGGAVVNGSCGADCKVACNLNFGDCNMMPGDGCEVGLASDDKNCGMCGNVCAANAKCTAGKCVNVAVEHGPEHTFSGLQSNHFITQGCCSVNCAQNQAADADYFCKRFYGNNCTAKPGYFLAQTPFPGYPKMHKRDGCTNQGLDIANTMCDGGPCKIGNWQESTTGLTNLVCVCN